MPYRLDKFNLRIRALGKAGTQEALEKFIDKYGNK
jgi:hypothetical protein